MKILGLGTVLPLGTVVKFVNKRGVVSIVLDYYGKLSSYTTQDIEAMVF